MSEEQSAQVEPELVTSEEFARRVGRSRPRIAQLVSAGRIPTIGKLIPWAEGRVAYLAAESDPAGTALAVQRGAISATAGEAKLQIESLKASLALAELDARDPLLPSSVREMIGYAMLSAALNIDPGHVMATSLGYELVARSASDQG